MSEQRSTKNQKKRTCVFVAVLAMAGVLHLFEIKGSLFQQTVFFCLVSSIYLGLLFFWALSVSRRLLPSRSRSYVLIAAGLMVFYILVRAFKYRIAAGQNTMMRIAWYHYYIPLLMIPTLFLMSCLRFYRSKEDGHFDERWIMLPAVMITAGILTNDLHRLAFLPLIPIKSLNGETGTYSYGILYYTACAWMCFTVAAGVFSLMKSFHRFREWKRGLIPPLFLAGIPLLMLVRAWMERAGIHPLYNEPEIHVFCLLGCFESMIRSLMLKIQHEQEERRTRLNAANRVLNRAGKEILPAQREISKLLDRLDPGAEDFDKTLARSCVLFAYVKRKGNFVLKDPEHHEVTADELVLALNELGRYLRYCDVRASVENRAEREYGLREALDLFDSAAQITYALLLAGTKRIIVCLKNDMLLLTADGTLPETLPILPLDCQTEEEDGLIYMTVRTEGGRAAC